MRALAAELTENADGRAWQVVAVAAEKGAAAGIALAGELTATPGDRDALLLAAGETLVTLRFYPHATALLSAGAKGADDPQQARARIELLSRIRRAEEAGVPTDDPRYPVVELFLAILAPAPRADQLSELFAEASLGSNEFSPGSEGLAGLRGIRHSLAARGFSPEFIRDIVMSVFQFSAEGSDEQGFRVRMQAAVSGRQETLSFLVVRQETSYRIAAFASTPSTVGSAVLGELDGGRRACARNFLDLAREEIVPAGGDDPVAAHPFPKFWTKGQEATDEQIREAAASLLVGSRSGPNTVSILTAGRERATSPAREKYDLALLRAYSSRGQRTGAGADRAQRARGTSGASESAFEALIQSLGMQEKWDEYAALLEERLVREPGNAQVLRLKEWAAVARGLPLETEALVTTLIAQGDARAVDLNNLAWSRFARGVSDEQTLEFARRAIAEGGSAASRHTLAALLAVSGQPREAREQILESMGTRGALGLVGRLAGLRADRRGIWRDGGRGGLLQAGGPSRREGDADVVVRPRPEAPVGPDPEKGIGNAARIIAARYR